MVAPDMTGLQAQFSLKRDADYSLALDLSIEPGQTLALLGPNGAGKTTAIAAIAGLLAIDTGQISLSGEILDDPDRDIFVAPEMRHIGVVFQDYLLFPHMTVAANVAFGMEGNGYDRAGARQKAASYLSAVGLDEMARMKPAELSGGQRQRVALARALAAEPALLLLDEPLSAIDVTTRASLRRDLSDYLSQFPGPRLLVTHEPSEAFLLADEIVILEDGNVTQAGSADDIRLAPKTDYAADVAGSNLLRGFARDGRVEVGGHVLVIPEADVSGEVLVSFHPSAVAVHTSRPEGSPRNTWATQIERIERHRERARLRLVTPLPLTAEVTTAAVEGLGLDVGSQVWVSVKATELRVEAAV